MAIEKIVTGKELGIPEARSLRNQKVKKKHDYNPIGHVLVGAAMLCQMLCVLGYFTFKEPVLDSIKEIKLKQAYTQALSQYGDTNGDGFVSAEENKELFQNIFYRTGINFNSQGAVYSDGRQVPASELIKIIRDYIEYPFPLIE